MILHRSNTGVDDATSRQEAKDEADAWYDSDL